MKLNFLSRLIKFTLLCYVMAWVVINCFCIVDFILVFFRLIVTFDKPGIMASPVKFRRLVDQQLVG